VVEKTFTVSLIFPLTISPPKVKSPVHL